MLKTNVNFVFIVFNYLFDKFKKISNPFLNSLYHFDGVKLSILKKQK